MKKENGKDWPEIFQKARNNATFFKRWFGIWTENDLRAVLDEELEIQKNSEYYNITNQEELREEKIRYLEFIFWKIFTR